MSVINEPHIEKKHHDDFTRITFEPDFKRFGMEYLDEDTEALLKKEYMIRVQQLKIVKYI
ncbi:hypothetical protein A0H76_380 [Hepatospora eriocheir]|uniref:Uncharacterized protein n=1 Tax=Hepatospora eriocheir TaxID=1081669 RepID=A0A1X0QIV1_9MICR|nr:hypothetical protein A0H76_380 [Hepatospora eriocheir]